MKLTIPITPELRVRLLHAENIEIEVPDTAVPENWQQDAARMDFLENCVMKNGGGCISANRDYNPHRDSKKFGLQPTVTLFTIQSQHVQGLGLRGAIDAAMTAAELRSKGGVA